MPLVRFDARNHCLRQNRQLIGRRCNPVFDTVHALPVAKFATIEPSTATRAVRQAFGACLGTYVEGVLQAAATASIATDQRPFDRSLDSM